VGFVADETPKLRLVDPDERVEPVPEPSSSTGRRLADDDGGDDGGGPPFAWVSAAVPLCIGIAILAVGLALSLRLLMDPKPSKEPQDDAPVAAEAGAPTSTIDPVALLPRASTSIGETTTTAGPTSVPTTAPPVAPTAAADPSLVPLPVVGGVAAAPPPAADPVPTTGSARIRIFNGFLIDTPLEVWEISGPAPVKYGVVPFAGLAEMTVGGRLLPSGVHLQLRFVRPGGDPTLPITEGTSSKTGPWGHNFTPADGSSQTVVLVPNPGLRVVRVDNVRALGAVPAGRVHVVPVAQHVTIGNSRALQWSADGVGCLGHTTGDKQEFDVPVGTPLRLASASDAECASGVSDAVVVGPTTAMAVVAMQSGAGAPHLVAVPLG
jgi:hypothetical protein